MTMPMMTHRHGACIEDEIDLHLGQKPKLGGRYADDPLIYISYFVGTLYIYVSLFFIVLVLISTFQNTKRPKIFPLFLLVVFLVF
jgi:hypothetical protein